MKYQIYQTRQNTEAVVLAETRRFNGALKIQEVQVQGNVQNLMEHSAPGERVVQGPTGIENEIAVIKFGPGTEYVVTVGIRPR